MHGWRRQFDSSVSQQFTATRHSRRDGEQVALAPVQWSVKLPLPAMENNTQCRKLKN
jgi:hypothetical protein